MFRRKISPTKVGFSGNWSTTGEPRDLGLNLEFKNLDREDLGMLGIGLHNSLITVEDTNISELVIDLSEIKRVMLFYGDLKLCNGKIKKMLVKNKKERIYVLNMSFNHCSELPESYLLNAPFLDFEIRAY